MGKEVEYFHRRLNDLDVPSGILDNNGIFSEATPKISVLKKNPNIRSNEDVFQILALYNNEVIGTEIHIPIKIVVDDNILGTLTGHCLFVNPQCRGMGIGRYLADQRLAYSDTKSLLLCNVSQMHPYLKGKDRLVFFMPRLIFLRKSYSVIENKANSLIAKLFSPLVDCVISFHRYLLLKQKNRILNLGFKVECVDYVPDSLFDILRKDTSRFKELHNKEWFEWVMSNSLITDDAVQKRLYMVYKDKTPVGFFMTKQKFYANASHRGFKNVTLGSIMEWATIDELVISNEDLCMLAIMSFGDEVTAVELCCENTKMARYFRKKGLHQVGCSNVVLKWDKDSEFAFIKGINDSQNWRLRPAMGDNSLS